MAGSEDFLSTAALNTTSNFSNTSVNGLGVVLGNGNRVGNCGQGSVSAVLVLFSGTGSPLFSILCVNAYQINASVAASASKVEIKVNIFHILRVL